VDERPLRVLVVDDEPLAQRRVCALLEGQEGVEIVGVADSGEGAVESIRSQSPDVVFLDIELGDGSGMEVIESLGAEIMPLTVFVTAHDEYAIESFRVEPVDYLLKPFADERFMEALDRARRRFRLKEADRLRDKLLALLQESDEESSGTAEPPEYLERLAVPMRGRVKIVPVDEIDHISASGAYSELHVGEKKYLLRASLTALEQQLDPHDFFRVHRSDIVRLDRIELLLRESGGEYRVQLRGGATIPVGRTRRSDLEALLGRL
jgi:two-component system LytT family response regulator